MLRVLDPMLCEKCYCVTESMWTRVIVVEDEFLLQFQSFLSSFGEQSFQNLTVIVLEIGGSFLFLSSGWDNMLVNDSMFVTKNDRRHFAN